MEDLGLSILFNGFWIVGLALLLATFSYHYDRAQRRNRSLRTQMGARSFATGAWLSVTLVSIGLAGTSARWWETIIWIVFALIGAGNAVGAWRMEPDSSTETPLPKD